MFRFVQASDNGANAQLVHDVHVSAGADEQIDHVDVIPVRRPVQRGRAIGLPGVDVDALLDERQRGFGVAVLHGFDQAVIRRRPKGWRRTAAAPATRARGWTRS